MKSTFIKALTEESNIIVYTQDVQGITEAVARRCLVENVFLEISQNSQENTCARAPFLIKLQASGVPVNFAEFSRGPIFIEQLRWLLLGLMVFGEEE